MTSTTPGQSQDVGWFQRRCEAATRTSTTLPAALKEATFEDIWSVNIGCNVPYPKTFWGERESKLADLPAFVERAEEPSTQADRIRENLQGVDGPSGPPLQWDHLTQLPLLCKLDVDSSESAAEEAKTGEVEFAGRVPEQRQQPPLYSEEMTSQQEAPMPLLKTVVTASIPSHHTLESFRQLLDSWGFKGAYDLVHVLPAVRESLSAYGTVSFLEPAWAELCQLLLQQYSLDSSSTVCQDPHLQQGSRLCWSQAGLLQQPVITHADEAAAPGEPNSELKFSPQIREQFHKTKLCTFHMKNKCALGEACPFAHTQQELQPTPNLAKTKLCYNFFRRRCQDSMCRFAHGYSELRATNNVYKTELCRWWSHRGCKAGHSCRYAHGVEELRGGPSVT